MRYKQSLQNQFHSLSKNEVEQLEVAYILMVGVYFRVQIALRSDILPSISRYKSPPTEPKILTPVTFSFEFFTFFRSFGRLGGEIFLF